MGKVDQLESDRALELLKIASLEGGKVIDKEQTARIQMVASLTAKELNKLVQFLQENVGDQNRLLRVQSDEIGEHVVNVFGAEASTKSFVQPLHSLLVVTDDSKHAETKGDLGALVFRILLLLFSLRGIRPVGSRPNLDVHDTRSSQALGQVLQHKVVTQTNHPILDLDCLGSIEAGGELDQSLVNFIFRRVDTLVKCNLSGALWRGLHWFEHKARLMDKKSPLSIVLRPMSSYLSLEGRHGVYRAHLFTKYSDNC